MDTFRTAMATVAAGMVWAAVVFRAAHWWAASVSLG